MGPAVLIRDAQRLLIMLIVCCIGGYRVAAQQTAPASRQTKHQKASSVRVVSIRMSVFGGFCACCSGGELQVSPRGVTLLISNSRECQEQDPHKYRNLKVDADLSGKHWKALERLIDHDALFALPDSLGCASCYDGLDEIIEVKFSDRTQKSVTFPYPGAPKELSGLSEKLLSLEAKLHDELPVGSGR